MPSKRDLFVDRWAPAVLEHTAGTPLSAALMMAQAIVESSDRYGNPGESTLARKYNNFFGIKADASWKGKKVNMQTGEVFNGQRVSIESAFRVYDRPEDSFRDRVRFLVDNPRYRKAGVFDAAGADDQARALQRAGYATAPNYAQTLISIMHSLQLHDLDKKKIMYMNTSKILAVLVMAAALVYVYRTFFAS